MFVGFAGGSFGNALSTAQTYSTAVSDSDSLVCLFVDFSKFLQGAHCILPVIVTFALLGYVPCSQWW